VAVQILSPGIRVSLSHSSPSLVTARLTAWWPDFRRGGCAELFVIPVGAGAGGSREEDGGARTSPWLCARKKNSQWPWWCEGAAVMVAATVWRRCEEGSRRCSGGVLAMMVAL